MYRRSSKIPARGLVLTVATAIFLAAAMFFLFLLTGCGAKTQTSRVSTAPRVIPVVQTPSKSDMSSFFNLTNTMALNLHKQVYKEDPASNLFLSPASAEIGPGDDGKRGGGETLSAIKNALGLSTLTTDQINRSNRAFIDSLAKLDHTITLDIANSLWLKSNLMFSAQFLADNTRYYDAEVRRVDFQ